MGQLLFGVPVVVELVVPVPGEPVWSEALGEPAGLALVESTSSEGEALVDVGPFDPLAVEGSLDELLDEGSLEVELVDTSLDVASPPAMLSVGTVDGAPGVVSLPGATRLEMGPKKATSSMTVSPESAGWSLAPAPCTGRVMMSATSGTGADPRSGPVSQTPVPRKSVYVSCVETELTTMAARIWKIGGDVTFGLKLARLATTIGAFVPPRHAPSEASTTPEDFPLVADPIPPAPKMDVLSGSGI
ncbi:MAG: hypothetical protein ACYDD6_12705 [Acidimicrobiales bacterium]